MLRPTGQGLKRTRAESGLGTVWLTYDVYTIVVCGKWGGLFGVVPTTKTFWGEGGGGGGGGKTQWQGFYSDLHQTSS